jgi:hypothetical protein
MPNHLAKPGLVPDVRSGGRRPPQAGRWRWPFAHPNPRTGRNPSGRSPGHDAGSSRRSVPRFLGTKLEVRIGLPGRRRLPHRSRSVSCGHVARKLNGMQKVRDSRPLTPINGTARRRRRSGRTRISAPRGAPRCGTNPGSDRKHDGRGGGGRRPRARILGPITQWPSRQPERYLHDICDRAASSPSTRAFPDRNLRAGRGHGCT